jgi:hypothetical protein
LQSKKTALHCKHYQLDKCSFSKHNYFKNNTV